ncbi:MAG TPA: AAA family ATPase [Solirubrobacteraceae bacterium]|nr:AAA family ATPase [Solirubrobacteraceae bacterium]
MGKLPGPLRLTPSFPFAGRSRELATLRTLIPRAAGEELRFALIGGEAGSGKSRLVREFALEAAAAGALVLYGACDSVVRRPYGPFVEAIEQLMRSIDEGTLLAGLGPHGEELARLLPDLVQRVGELPLPIAADPDTERHRLHVAVGDLLAAAGARAPLVVVIEDGHWADTPTLLLLRHLARGAAEARVLVVTTFRDTEAEVPEALSAALADLRRSDGVVRLRLAGLSTEEISEFVERAVGDALAADLPHVARLLSELTGGNAFLMTELWRTLLESGTASAYDGGQRLARALAELGSPEGVREVVSQRLARLNTTTTRVLELAAVAGPEFDLSAIGRSGLADEERTAALEQAIAHGMIEEVPSTRLAFRFTHELVRRALYDRMPRLRRAELHLRVAEALERAHSVGESRGLAELAYHFGAAAPVDGPRRAIEYSLLAGRSALRTLDFDEAATRFSIALELGIDDLRRRAETQLELGTARFRAGGSDDAMQAFRAAAQIARDIGDPSLLAHAAVGFEEACWRPGIIDEGAVELLEEASHALGDEDSELRVMLLAGLGRAYAFVGDYAASDAVRQRAITMARELDDRLGLATVLVRSYWSRGDGSLAQTLAMLSEARELADGLGASDLQTEAMEWRVAGLIAQGDLRVAEQELAEVHALAVRLRQPFTLHVAEHYASTIALCVGRLADAEGAAQRSHEWSRLLTGRAASGIHGIQMFGIRREQGRLAELAAVTRVLAGGDRLRGAWRPAFAALLAELGMEEDARRELARVREKGLDEYRSTLWVASLTYLTDACALVGDEALAGQLYAEFAPLSGRNVVIGNGVACYGAADRYLGRLAASLGEHERAIEHFERALTVNRVTGATTWIAHTLYEYGRTLRMRGRPNDDGQASALLAEAATLAERIGMPVLLSRARSLGARTSLAATPPDDLSWREVDILRLVAAGLSNREIGQELCISGHTVANHVRSILRKTGTANRTEAAGYAHRHGLLDATRRR